MLVLDSDICCLEVSSSNFHWSITQPDWVPGKTNLSNFDDKLFSLWKEAGHQGRFKYDVSIDGSKVLPGKWKFLAELNLQRGMKRRKPHDLSSLNQPFNPDLFNFTQIHREEILCRLKLSDQSKSPSDEDIIAINNSPINERHCLLLPAVNRTYPQVMTEHGIHLGLQVLLMSKCPALRVVFNGLCAYASVNHLHLHLIYVTHSMPLESCILEPLMGPCWQLVKYPGKAFVFQSALKCDADVVQLARNVHKLTDFLKIQNEAYNLCITRSRTNPTDSELSSVRVFVWVRTPSTGSKNTSGFNPAACELFGFILYTDKELYEINSEDHIAAILQSVTSEPFERNRPFVEKLFSEGS